MNITKRCEIFVHTGEETPSRDFSLKLFFSLAKQFRLWMFFRFFCVFWARAAVGIEEKRNRVIEVPPLLKRSPPPDRRCFESESWRQSWCKKASASRTLIQWIKEREKLIIANKTDWNKQVAKCKLIKSRLGRNSPSAELVLAASSGLLFIFSSRARSSAWVENPFWSADKNARDSAQEDNWRITGARARKVKFMSSDIWSTKTPNKLIDSSWKSLNPKCAQSVVKQNSNLPVLCSMARRCRCATFYFCYRLQLGRSSPSQKKQSFFHIKHFCGT
jgi:hypothetical protein